MKKLINVTNVIIAVMICVVCGFIFWVFSHTHVDPFKFSKSYCPKCYTPAVIRIDMQKKCENCGYNFYLTYDEIPERNN